MTDSSGSTAPAEKTPQPATNDPRDEQTARILEEAAFMDEDDHPSVLADTIGMLIEEIHELRPDLQHSSNWLTSENPETAAIQEARWRGATLRSIREIGVKRSLQVIDRARSYCSQLAHRIDPEGESHG